MTKLIVQSDNQWTKKKIKSALDKEKELLRRAIQRSQRKVDEFEKKYGKFDKHSLYGNIDDMQLLEWEGETETVQKLREKLTSFEEITLEYK